MASSFSILEQPQTRGHRFRYETEKRDGGNILGEKADSKGYEKKSCPKLHLETPERSDQHYVLVSCVEAEPHSFIDKEPQYRLHPCQVVGKHTRNGDANVCKIFFDKNTSIANLRSLGIQIVSKKFIASSIENQIRQGLDFYNLGTGQNEAYDMKRIRLAFQVHVFEKKTSTYSILPPKVSNVIIDYRTDDPLMIHLINVKQASLEGGTTIMLFTSKINKTEINIAFQDEQGNKLNHIEVDKLKVNYYGQNGISFETPKLENGAKTKLYLWRQNKDQVEKSNLIDFEFTKAPWPVILIKEIKEDKDDPVIQPKPFWPASSKSPPKTKRSIATNTTETEEPIAKRQKVSEDISHEDLRLKLHDVVSTYKTVIDTLQQSLATDVNYLLDLIP